MKGCREIQINSYCYGVSFQKVIIPQELKSIRIRPENITILMKSGIG